MKIQTSNQNEQQLQESAAWSNSPIRVTTPLTEQQFWNTRLTPKPSTFGTAKRRSHFDRQKLADPKKDPDHWIGHDQYCSQHSRLDIRTPLLVYTLPGAHGSEGRDPDCDETVGSIWAKRPPRAYMVPRREAPVTTVTPSPMAYNTSKSLLDPKNVNRPPPRNVLPVPGHEIRAGVVPGPTHYGIMDVNATGRFELDPQTALPPRTDSPVRSKLLMQSLQIDDGCTPGPGQYDPKLPGDKKRNPGVTMGIRLPLAGAKDVLPDGYSQLDPAKAYGFGIKSVLSGPPPKEAFNRMETTPNFTVENKILSFAEKKAYGGYKSDYEYPKIESKHAERGRVFYSTVQNMPQHHRGKHAPGCFIKT